MCDRVITVSAGMQSLLDLTKGRSIKLASDCKIRISDSGVIEVQRGDSSTTFYPAHAWQRLQFVDPYALAASIMAKQLEESECLAPNQINKKLTKGKECQNQ